MDSVTTADLAHLAASVTETLIAQTVGCRKKRCAAMAVPLTEMIVMDLHQMVYVRMAAQVGRRMGVSMVQIAMTVVLETIAPLHRR